MARRNVGIFLNSHLTKDCGAETVAGPTQVPRMKTSSLIKNM
jgi:hypothetical protein